MSTSTDGRAQALLLIGAMGTGKSDTSYHVFSRLFRAGVPTARIDLGDVGMCHPAPDDDPDNFAVKADVMSAAWRVFRSHGARCFVVSGGIDRPQEVENHLKQLPDVEWTVVRLRIGSEERRRRVLRRGLLLGYTEAEMEPTVQASDADHLHVETLDLPGLVLDTDGLTSREVINLVLSRTGWPSAAQAEALVSAAET